MPAAMDGLLANALHTREGLRSERCVCHKYSGLGNIPSGGVWHVCHSALGKFPLFRCPFVPRHLGRGFKLKPEGGGNYRLCQYMNSFHLSHKDNVERGLQLSSVGRSMKHMLCLQHVRGTVPGSYSREG